MADTHALVDTLLPRESAGAEERRGGVEANGVARHGDVSGQEEERGGPHGEEALAAWLGLRLGWVRVRVRVRVRGRGRGRGRGLGVGV